MQNFEVSRFYKAVFPSLHQLVHRVKNPSVRLFLTWYMGAALWMSGVLFLSFGLDYLLPSPSGNVFFNELTKALHDVFLVCQMATVFWGAWYFLKLNLLYTDSDLWLPRWLNRSMVSLLLVGVLTLGIIMVLGLPEYLNREGRFSLLVLLTVSFCLGVGMPTLSNLRWFMRLFPR